MIYVFHVNTDDKENGWFPPSISSGKIYVNARGWTSYPQDSEPTYDQAEHFLRFLDKYVSHAVGNHYFLQWIKLNRSKTFLDKVTASDIAYTILVYENTKEVWAEDLQIKASYKTDKERCNATHLKKPKYHVGRGKHLKKFGNGWTDNGQEYYQELLMIFKELKSSDVWNTLQDNWKLYQKKHYTRDDNQVEELREAEEECEASDKDDWQIEMLNGDEIEDIEEACVHDDSPPPRNRQRLSC
jgi:hypothetical protein